MVAMAGETGMDLRLDAVPGVPALSAGQILYSESCGRFIVTIDPKKQTEFESLFSDLPAARVGVVTDSDRFRIYNGEGEPLVDEAVSALKSSWTEPFGDLI
jgi:phosphoribosylformylglycinamidine synthase